MFRLAKVVTGAVVATWILAGGPWAFAATATSPNWSGYVAQAAARFTAVTGTWTQPAVECTGVARAVSSFWVGLDGYSDQTVEQIGVQAKCIGGVASYYAWWQMWPSPYQDLSPTEYPVRPSDVLTASVARSGASYRLSLRSSAGWHYAVTQTGVAEDSSAEWIASSPRLCHTCHFALLSDFGRVTFTDTEAATGGPMKPLSSFDRAGGPTALTMIGATSGARARPGPLSPAGRSFAVTWEHL